MPPTVTSPPVAVDGVKPVPANVIDDTPDEAADAAIVTVPVPFVIVTFDPAVRRARLNPVPLPINN
jgi:hypothetical protein